MAPVAVVAAVCAVLLWLAGMARSSPASGGDVVGAEEMPRPPDRAPVSVPLLTGLVPDPPPPGRVLLGLPCHRSHERVPLRRGDSSTGSLSGATVGPLNRDDTIWP